MATKLEKDITRESSIKVDDREIIVTMTEAQGISMKLKGMKSGIVSIPISELYTQLAGVTPSVEAPKKQMVSIKRNATNKEAKAGPMISLTDLRSHNAISVLDYETLVKFEGIIKSMMDNYPEKYGNYYNDKEEEE